MNLSEVKKLADKIATETHGADVDKLAIRAYDLASDMDWFVHMAAISKCGVCGNEFQSKSCGIHTHDSARERLAKYQAKNAQADNSEVRG